MNFIKSVFLLIGILISCRLAAQDSARVAQDDVTILYRNEAEGGINVHSNGFGITFKRGWHVTGYKKRMLDIDIVSMRHPKQYNHPE